MTSNAPYFLMIPEENRTPEQHEAVWLHQEATKRLGEIIEIESNLQKEKQDLYKIINGE